MRYVIRVVYKKNFNNMILSTIAYNLSINAWKY